MPSTARVRAPAVVCVGSELPPYTHTAGTLTCDLSYALPRANANLDPIEVVYGRLCTFLEVKQKRGRSPDPTQCHPSEEGYTHGQSHKAPDRTERNRPVEGGQGPGDPLGGSGPGTQARPEAAPAKPHAGGAHRLSPSRPLHPRPQPP